MYSCKPIRKILTLIVISLFLSLYSTSFAAVAVPDVAATDAAGVERAKAGMALYKAKESGRNRVMLADTRLVIQETPTSAIQMEIPPVTH